MDDKYHIKLLSINERHILNRPFGKLKGMINEKASHKFLLKIGFGPLTGDYLVDLYDNEINISPKGHFLKGIFRVSNCS